MLKVPLRPLKNQVVNIVLAQQPCTITVYQKSTGLFFDLAMNGSKIVSAVLGRDRVRMVRGTGEGFAGDFAFFDEQGRDDPVWDGLGGRWILVYLEASNIA